MDVTDLAHLRSRLRQRDALGERTTMPTAGQTMSEQTGIVTAPETRQALERRCGPDL